MDLFVDRTHSLPRAWSNRELRKYAHLFHGNVVNVSGWQDIDKEGKHYRDYFANAYSYTITNYLAEARGFQGYKDEVFLDLCQELPESLKNHFDVVFNHTTLEHIFDVKTAFSNLCDLSRDIVIIVVPFLQQYHSDYGDYWRFSPLAIKRLFNENGLAVLYQSFNSNRMSSVYTFTIASKCPEKWKDLFNWSFSCVDAKERWSIEPYIGCRSIPNLSYKFKLLCGRFVKLIKKVFLWMVWGILQTFKSFLFRPFIR